MAKDINVNYNGQYSYSICIRSDFNDLIPMLNEKVKKSYDKVCIVTDSNVASHYLSDLLEIFK
ncbi:MAG: 3-dehydroquinate synthase, partial [Pseudobutyrivibrio sp.]|nr:3-dehydroquinate synthase [Pseudobutyrivibrio sp.]